MMCCYHKQPTWVLAVLCMPALFQATFFPRLQQAPLLAHTAEGISHEMGGILHWEAAEMLHHLFKLFSPEQMSSVIP